MKKYVLALDLGGTNSVFGIVDQEGNILHTDSFSTPSYSDIDAYVQKCADTVKKLCEHIGGLQTVQALGIGAPDVNYWEQTIENATNLPWKGIVPLAEKLHKSLNIPVRMTNDAKAAALGEMRFGAAKGMKDFIVLTLGTGVGSGIVVNGKLVYGKRSFAGELGHVSVRPENGRPCPCGRKGCLEVYCSATGVAQTARELLASGQYPDSLLYKVDRDKLNSKQVYDAAKAGDTLANDVFAFTGKILGEGCADFATFSDPEAFIFFGGLTKGAECWLPIVEETYRKTVFENYRDTAKFLLSGLKDADAALLGAAALAWTEVE